MDGQKSSKMGWSGSENLLQEDEVFHGLSPLDFGYPESSSINFDLDATYLLDNPSGSTIHSSMDVLLDPTVVHEGGISVGQDGKFGLPNQELATMNSLSLPDKGMPETSFSSFLTQEMTSLNVLDQEISGISFSSFLSQEMNSLDVPSHDLSGTSFLSFPTHELNSLSFSSQGLSMMDHFNFPTQELYLNTLELPNQGLSMMDTFGLPTQEALMNPIEFPNPGLPMTDTLGLPTQELFMNTLELPNQGASMLESLSFPTQDLMPLAFPYQTQPMTMIMEHVTENEGANIVISSGYEQLQQEFDPNDGNGNGNGNGNSNGNGDGAGGSNSNPPLRQTLSKEMISQYFHLSLTDAAKALNVGKTLLKTRCRELDIARWPQRKFKSLQTIISNLQEFGQSSGGGVEENVQERIRRLENERKRMEDTPNLQLEDDTIRLRQAYYKSSHKKRKQSDRDH